MLNFDGGVEAVKLILKFQTSSVSDGTNFYFILYSETQCISKLDKIGVFIDMKFH